MKEKLCNECKSLFIVIALIYSVVVIFSVNLIQVDAQVANGDEYNSVLQKITNQVSDENHVPLSEKATWKFKWIVFTDVTFKQENATSEHRVLTEDDERYSTVIVEEFKQVLEKTNPNIKVDIDLEFYRTPIQVITSNNDFILHESQIANILEDRVAYGAYDSIFVVSESQGGGGVTKANYYSDITRGSAYSAVGLSTSSADNYPAHSTNRTIEYSTEIALHEFCHQMEMAGLIDTYPNVHGSSSYGYVYDAHDGWTQFYLDFLTGNVKDSNTGKLIGIYPEMWRVTPRYLQEITPPVRGGTWTFKPNGLPSQSIDGIEKIYIPIDYKNAFGSSWFDLTFNYGSDSIDTTQIHSSNTNSAQVLNFDGGVARIKVVGLGETELSFATKENNFVYRKKVNIYDLQKTNKTVNGLFVNNDTLNPLRDSTTQQSIEEAKELVNLLPSELANDFQEAISKAQRELDDQLTLIPLVLSTVYVNSNEIVVKGAPSAKITLSLPNGTKITKTTDSNGETRFNLFSLKEGDIIEAFQTYKGVKGKQVTTSVRAIEIKAPVVNNYYMNSTYVSGTVAEGTKRIALAIEGLVVRYGEIAENGTYKIYAGDVLLTADQNFTVIPIGANGKRGSNTNAVVQDKRIGRPTINEYFVGATYLSGTVSTGTKRIALSVNSKIIRYGEVSENGTYKIYASDVLLTKGQNFTIIPVDKSGLNGHESNGTVKEDKVGPPVVHAYYEGSPYITGVVSERTKRIAVVKDGEIVRFGEIAENGTYKIYAGDILLTAGGNFMMLPINETGLKGEIANVTVKEFKLGNPTIDTYYPSNAYISGTVAEGTKRIALVVEGNVIRYGEITSNGSYKLYAGDILLVIGQEFKVVPINKDGLKGNETTGIVS
ncbi:immunoglobulin-like domain-containing protein [Listeria monocytogenes]